MKMALNNSLIRIAKTVLLKDDIETISKITGIAVSGILDVIAGRKKAECDVIDCIQKMAALRLDQNKITLDKERIKTQEKCYQQTKK